MAHGGGEVGGDDHTTRYTHAAMYIHIISIYLEQCHEIISTWSRFAVSSPIFMFFMFVVLNMQMSGSWIHMMHQWPR